MADINDEVNAIAEHLRRLNHEFDRYANLTSQSSDAVRQRTAAEKHRDQQLETSGRAAADSLKDFGRAAGTYTSTMYQGANGASALNTTISQVTSGLGNLAIALAALVTPGGVVKKAFAAALAAVGVSALELSNKIANAGREMVDAQYKSYSEMAKSGAVANEGMQGVADGAHKLGLNILEMDKYLGLIAGNSGALAMFQKSAYDGRKQFELLGAALKTERSTFKALGMDQNALNEGQMGYLRLLTRTGQVQQLTVEQLKTGVKSYLLEQDALTKLTGTSRKEAEDIKARALMEEKFRAEQDEMLANGQADAAKNVQDFNTILEKIAPRLASGYRAGITGNLATKEAQQFLQATNGAMPAIIALSKTDPAKAADMLAEELRKNNEMIRPLARQGASEAAFGPYAEKADFIAVAQGKGKDGFAGVLKEILAAQEAQRGKTGVLGPDGKTPLFVDKRLQQQVELLDLQQETNMLLQQLINQNLSDLKVGGKIGADYAQIEAINYEKFARERLLTYVKAANPELFKKYQTENADKKGAFSEETVKGLVEAADKQLAAMEQNKGEISAKLREKLAEQNQARERLDQSKDKSESEKLIAKREFEKRLEEYGVLQLQLERNLEDRKQATQEKARLEQQLKDSKKPVTETAKDSEVVKAAEAAKTESAKVTDDAEARARVLTEQRLREQNAARETENKKSDDKKTAEIEKARAALLSPIPELKVGGKTAYKDLVQEQKDAINNLLFEEKMNLPVMGQTPEDGDRGKEAWEKQLKQSPAGQKALFDAINQQIKNDRKQKLKELEKQESGKTSEAAPNDYRKNYGVADTAALADSQVAAATTKAVNIAEALPTKTDISNATTKAVNIAEALPTKTDISNATAGLTINSDVATLNSKGMNVSLDNSADVARLIMAPVIEQVSSAQKDQSQARSSFESTIGDLKTELSKQKATDELLLAAVQELIRIQKNGVEVQQKIYRATV